MANETCGNAMRAIRGFIGGLIGGLMMILVLAGAAAGQDNEAPPSQLQDYLRRHNLQRLHVRSLEIQLSSELDQTRRRGLASQLAGYYQEYFFSQNSAADQGFVNRAKQLMRDYPFTSSPSLRIAIQHSVFLAAERSFQKWWQSGSQPRDRDKLSNAFLSLLNELIEIQRLNNQELERAMAAPDFEQSEILARSNRIAKIENRILHANYLLGWVNYFQAIVPLDIEQQKLTEAERSFREFLQLEADKSIVDYGEDWFDQTTDWNVRAMIGLAMVFQAQSKNDSSNHCFHLIAKLAAKNQIQINRRVWQYRSLVYGKQWTAAVNFAKELDAEKTDELVGIWPPVLDSAKTVSRRSPESARLLLRHALVNLARRFKIEPIVEFNKQSDGNGLEDAFGGLLNGSFEDGWLRGYIQLHEALQEKKSLQAARLKLESALAKVDTTKDDPIDVLACTYLLGSIAFHEQRYENAAQYYSQIASGVKDRGSSLRLEAEWLQIQSLIEMARLDRRNIGNAFDAIESLKSNPNAGQFHSRLEFEELRLSARLMPPQEAKQRFSRYDSHHPLFSQARFEMLLNQFRLWQQKQQQKKQQAVNVGNDSGSESKAFLELQQLQQEYCQTSPPPSPQRKIQAMLVVFEARLGRASTAEEMWAALAEMESHVASTPAESPLRTKLDYYAFVTAKKFHSTDVAARTQKLLGCGNTRYERVALLHLAKQYDPVFESLVTASNEQLTDATKIYRQLSQSLGNSQSELAESKNARLAASRLVDLQICNGQFSHAAAGAARLVKAFPENSKYTAQSARAYSQSGQLENALPLWRKIAGGSSASSRLWLEAKYWTVKCLASKEPEKAKSILRQTISLSGELAEPWKTKFAELQTLLPSE